MTICNGNAVLPESNLNDPFCSPEWLIAAAAIPLIDLNLQMINPE